uniref:Uncharacterized protein n=1 Tax=Quercus lobata TaxID=97700 RepID=A0A7N2MI72_QUELO
MARGLTFTTVGLTVLFVLVLVHPTCCAPTAMVNHTFSASSCGNIHNISFPFRLSTDPQNCGDPRYGAYPYDTYLRKGTQVNYRDLELSRSLVLMSCEKPVNSSLYLDTSTCNYNDNSSSISDSKRYRYLKVGITNASQVEESCKVEKMFRTSWPEVMIQIFPVKTSTMNWYVVLSFHGSKVFVLLIAEEISILATSMTRTTFNA